MNYNQIAETVSKLFISVDNREWDNVKSLFDDTVLLDYTSMAEGSRRSYSQNRS